MAAEMRPGGIPADGIAVIDPDTPTAYNPKMVRGMVARVVIGPVWADLTPDALRRLIERAALWLKTDAERVLANIMMRVDDHEIAGHLQRNGIDIATVGDQAAAEVAAIIKAR